LREIFEFAITLVSLILGQSIEFAACSVRVDFNVQFGWERDVMAICSGEKEKYRERVGGREGRRAGGNPFGQ